jgi:DNA-binding NarL/FixJ family response regulator
MGVVPAVPVGIIEAQLLFAPFLAQLLSEAGYTVVCLTESIDADELGRVEPHVVLVDIDFLEEESVGALRRLRAVLPEATICAYTGAVDPAWISAIAAAGANCIITKLASPEEIVDGITRAIRLGTYVDERLTLSHSNHLPN